MRQSWPSDVEHSICTSGGKVQVPHTSGKHEGRPEDPKESARGIVKHGTDAASKLEMV